MKVALLFAGPYNGNENTVVNHQNFIGNYDTYVSCFNHYTDGWVQSGFNIKKISTTPTIKFKETDWFKYRNDKPGQSGFWQFWNLRSVVNSIEYDYDFYIKSRADLEFQHIELTMDFQPNTFYCPNYYFNRQTWDSERLLNDQFYIGDKNVMKCVSEFPMEFYKTTKHILNASQFSNELSLRIWLNKNGISVKGINATYKKIRNGNRPSGENEDYQLEKL